MGNGKLIAPDIQGQRAPQRNLWEGRSHDESVVERGSKATKKPPAVMAAEGARARATIALLRRIHGAHGRCRIGARNTCSAGAAGRTTRNSPIIGSLNYRPQPPFSIGSPVMPHIRKWDAQPCFPSVPLRGKRRKRRRSSATPGEWHPRARRLGRYRYDFPMRVSQTKENLRPDNWPKVCESVIR